MQHNQWKSIRDQLPDEKSHRVKRIALMHDLFSQRPKPQTPSKRLEVMVALS